MSRKPSPSKPASQRRWLLTGAAAALFLAALIFALRQGGSATRSTPENSTHPAAKTAGNPQDADDSADANGETRPRTRRSDRPDAGNDTTDSDTDGDEPGPRFPMVDALLGDDSLSTPDTVRSLLEIANNPQAPEAERLDALAHGLNLDFASFIPLAADTTLPVPMAERLLHEIANQGDLPGSQIEGCLGLLDHPDEAVQSQAVERLAFLLDDQSPEPQVDALRAAAKQRIEELAAQPAPEQNPTNAEDPPLAESPAPPSSTDGEMTGPEPAPEETPPVDQEIAAPASPADATTEGQ